MLTELLKTSIASRGKVPQPDRQPGLSCSALFPRPYFLYKVQSGEVWGEELQPRQILNLEDGWDQEEQSVRRLKEVGIIVKNRQAKVTVGKSEVPGSIDGEVELDKRRLWEHKAWSSSRFDWFVANGIDAYPGEKAQVNAYMLGRGLDECIFFVKRKEDNDYYDTVVKLDKDYILPIIEWADRIRLDGWIPEPKLGEYCAHCGMRCFGQVIDFSWIKEASASEMADRWRKGDQLVKVGSMLKEEARTYFVGSKDGSMKGLMGDESLLIVEGLRIQRILQHRFSIRKERVLQEFGPEGLMKVGEESRVISYRITSVEE